MTTMTAAPKTIRTEANATAWLEATGTEICFAVDTKEDGTKTVTIPMPCGRCGGSGWGSWFQDGGRCYECRGANTRNRKIVRSLKQHVQILKRKHKASEKKSADRAAARERSLEGQRDWCDKNTEFGRVTFDEKDELVRAARQAASATKVHVGTVGKRETFTVTIKAVPSWEGSYGWQFCHIMEDDDGNSLVWITGGELRVPVIGPVDRWSGQDARECDLKGVRVTIKATVKEHGVRDGAKQTKLTRVKLISREWTTA